MPRHDNAPEGGKPPDVSMSRAGRQPAHVSDGIPIISPHPPQHRRSLEKATVEELRALEFSYRAMAEQLGSNYSAVYRLVNRSTPDSAPSGEPTVIQQNNPGFSRWL